MDDLELKDLGNFIGTMQYHKLSPLFKTVATDGVVYIMGNGYSWFVTDTIAVIEHSAKIKRYLQTDNFLAVKLKVNDDKTAKVTIEDGNGKKLYSKNYKYTDAERDLILYWESGVLLLSGER